ncbi:unnamed protein product [Ixodes hexagonus]
MQNPGVYWSEATAELKRKVSHWPNRDLFIFAMATACNIFLVAKLMYVLQVLQCTRSSMQKVHRICAMFIWKSSWEPMKRANLFRRIPLGGVGLAHLFVRKLVLRFFFLRDIEQPFMRTVIQTKLAWHLPAFLVSGYEEQSSKIGGFLREVVDAYNFLSVRFSREFLSCVNRRGLSHALYDTLFPEPLYRAVHTKSPGQDVLCRVKKMAIQPRAKSFFFKLHTSTLPVKAWLHEKGIFVPWTTNCLLCKTPETIEHVFIFCWDAFLFWDVLQRTFKKDLKIASQSIRFLPITSHERVPYDLIMLVGLYSIWCSRMAVRNADLNPRPVEAYFVEFVTQIRCTYSDHDVVPQWVIEYEKLCEKSKFM